MRGVNFVIGGFWEDEKSYQELCARLYHETNRPTLYIKSLRSGLPSTKLWGNPALRPLILQAAHVADGICEAIEQIKEEYEVHIYAHSMGVPIGALCAVQFRTVLNVTSFTPLCPAGVSPEAPWRVEARIGRMALHDILTSSEGRRYWWDGRSYAFGHMPGSFRRSLQEGACVARCGITRSLLIELERQGTNVKAFLAPDDSAFSYVNTHTLLAAVVPCFDLPIGTGHNPQFNSERLIKALEANGALYL